MHKDWKKSVEINKNGKNEQGWRVGMMEQIETRVAALLLYLLFSYSFDFEACNYVSYQKLN